MPAGAFSEPIPARTTGRFHHVPGGAGSPLLLGFHGYGEGAASMLAELVRLPEIAGWSLAAVEALHPFYTKRGDVVRSWMTREDRELAIADNLAYVAAVLARLAELGEHPWWVACGFSQGAAMAWRAAAGDLGGPPCRAVIALGGDVPPDLDGSTSLPVERALLGRGGGDEWYTVEKLASDRERLRARGLVAEVCEFAGGHEWTPAFRAATSAFLRGLG